MTKANEIADIPAHVLEERYAKLAKLFDEADAIMHDTVVLSDEQRLHAQRLNGQEEVDGLNGVIDFAEARPELFKDLANEDNGVDPAVFETKLLRARLANAQLLSKMLERIEQTRAPIADSALYLATLVKPPIQAAYEIAKPLQARDKEHGKKLAPMVNFYHQRSMASVQTRKENAAKKAKT